MPQASRRIDTQRLTLVAPDPDQAAAVADFFARNAAHLAPWEPPAMPVDGDTIVHLQRKLAEGAEDFAAGRAHRWWLALTDAPNRVIGSAHLSSIARGPFQSCNLGYALDRDCQGQGLMYEALTAVITEAFSPRIHLHRIQAAIRPDNRRSLTLADRLGFADEGLARDYLFIAGAWRDHRLLALTNPGFVPPPGW
jgi:ribosomal-protein-alanine N-acetyltransferase